MKLLALFLLATLTGGGISGGGLSPVAGGSATATMADDMGASRSACIGPKCTVHFNWLNAIASADYSGDTTEARNIWLNVNYDSTGLATWGNWEATDGTNTHSKEEYHGRPWPTAATFECPMGGGDVAYIVSATLIDKDGTLTKTKTIDCYDPLGANGIADADKVAVDTSTNTCPNKPSDTPAITCVNGYSDLKTALNTELGASSSCGVGGCKLVVVESRNWTMTTQLDRTSGGDTRIVGVGTWGTYAPEGAGWSGNVVDFDCTTCSSSSVAVSLDTDQSIHGISWKNENTCTDVTSCPAGPNSLTQSFFGCDGGSTHCEAIDNITQFPSHVNLVQYTNVGISGGSNYEPVDTDGKTAGVDYMRTTEGWVIGYTSDRGTTTEHGIRNACSVDTFMGHGDYRNWGAGKTGMTARGCGNGSSSTGMNIYANSLVEFDQGGTGDWGILMGPQNNSNTETVSDSYVARNFLYFKSGGSNIAIPINIQGPDNTVEHNVVLRATGDQSRCVGVEERGTTGISPDNSFIMNNHCVVDVSTSSDNDYVANDGTGHVQANNYSASDNGTFGGGAPSNGDVECEGGTCVSDLVNAATCIAALDCEYADILLGTDNGGRTPHASIDVDRQYDGTAYTDDSGPNEGSP